jgi:2-oxoglutarate ferredoxin oxidoreductase subunit alpha
MLEDVNLCVPDRPVAFYGRMGGVVPMPDEILTAIEAQMTSLAPVGA